MFTFGIKASELIKQLENLVAQHGDKEVFVPSGTFPSGVGGAIVEKRENGYVPMGAIVLWTKGS